MEQRIGRPEYGGMFAAGEEASVPYVLPGELVGRENRPAEGLEVLESSSHRVAPGCVHFGTCGGCHYQHAEYDFQLALKQQILTELLSDAGLGDLPQVQVLAGEPWGYRNRIRLRVRADAGRAIEFGYSLAGTNTFLPVTMCPIAAPLLWRAVEALRELAGTDRRAKDWLAVADEVELFTDGEEQRLQVQFLLREAGGAAREPGGFAAFCEALRVSVPELVGAGALLAPELSRRMRRSWAGAGWGAAGLNYDVAGRRYWVSRGAFFQVNRFLVEELVGLVAGEAGTGGVAWDLFAGVGLFTRPLAEGFGRVVAVEGAEQAATDLIRAGKGFGGRGAYTAVQIAAVDFLRQQQTQRERPEVVVLDPPRAGLGAEGSALLERLAPARIVYVSCDPVTLARDLRVLVEAGYRVRTVHLVDLFPQTFHMETVVRLERCVLGGRRRTWTDEKLIPFAAPRNDKESGSGTASYFGATRARVIEKGHLPMRLKPVVERLRLRRVPLAAAAVWFACGILFQRLLQTPTGVLLGVLLLLAALSVVCLRWCASVAWVTVAAVWVVLGVAAAAWQPSAPIPVKLLGLADNLSRTVDATVTRVRVLPPRAQNGAAADADQAPPWEMVDQSGPEGEQALSVDLAVDHVEYVTPDISRMVPVEAGVRVTIYAPPAALMNLGCGDRLELPLRMRTPDEYRDPGAFDYGAYLLAQDGLAARAGVAGNLVRVTGNSSAGWRCRLTAVQGWAVGRLAKLVASPANGFLPAGLRLNTNDAGMLLAMLFGDRTGLSHTLRIDFERTGTFHLFVVSGLHVALVAAGLLWFLRRLRLPLWLATLGTIGGASVYAALTGFGQPTQRALAMTSMYLLARLLSRNSDRLNALGAAALGMLVWSPSSLFGASLQMTVLVIVAIAGIAVPLNGWLFGRVLAGAKDAWRSPRQSFDPAETQVRVALEVWGEAIGDVLGVWARGVPARLLVFAIRVAELALAGVVTELILALPMAIYFHRAAVFALPANMVVLPVVGLLAALAVATFAASLLSPWIALLPGAATAGLLHSLTWAIARLGHVNGADVRVPGPSMWIAAVAVALWLGCCWMVRRGRLGAWATAAALPLIAVMILWPEPALRTPGTLELTAIDVGQGDSLLAVGPDGSTMLIDGGGPIGSHGVSEIVSNFDVGEQVVSPYLWTRRVRRLDVVVLTHAHTDHIGGLPAVLRNFRPRELWVGIDPGSQLYRTLLAEAAQLGITVRHLHAGDRPVWGSVGLEVLAPAAGYSNRNAPKNDDSLVLRMQLGKASVLLEGDAERPSEDAMLAANLVSPVTLLKVGHHGSKTSSTPEFLKAAQPKDAVISVGRHNPFGHPYGDVIERFAARKTRLFRTDEFGLTTFLLRPDGGVDVTVGQTVLSPQESGSSGRIDFSEEEPQRR